MIFTLLQHLLLRLWINKMVMKNIRDIIIGALVFISLDRLTRVVSSNIVDKAQDTKEVKKSMLKIELFTLILVIFIAMHFVKF